jgi:hypothetical protein
LSKRKRQPQNLVADPNTRRVTHDNVSAIIQNIKFDATGRGNAGYARPYFIDNTSGNGYNLNKLPNKIRMWKINLCFFIFIILLLFPCCKKTKPQFSTTYIPNDFKEYTVFQSGSHWVFKN